jgi:CDP-paratose 2-epimerase
MKHSGRQGGTKNHENDSLQSSGKSYTMITGGAGFIGTNLAHRLLKSGRRVLIFDNLSRPGVEWNVRWLTTHHGENVQVRVADVRNRCAVREAVRGAEQVFHLAAQVAVTTSLQDPIQDFEVNVQGTLNLLEELRGLPDPPPLIFTSTNKVYGALKHITLHKNSTRYEPADSLISVKGVNEHCLLDFYSPYGCSKGAAEQYVIDYARTFRLPAVVFRMSCIYGPHQFGTEDQGWVAYFLGRALEKQPITLYGDGMQVRDILFVDDLTEAFLLAQSHIQELSGQAFNIGGGPENTISLLELLAIMKELHRGEPAVSFETWRAGDQRYYVSDISKFGEATGWYPKVTVLRGIEMLNQWLIQYRSRSFKPLATGAQPA